MAYSSGFFNAVDQGSGTYDRVYKAEDFAHYFSRFVGNGVFPNPTTGLQVMCKSAPDMSVKILPGDGWIDGYYITVTEAESLTVNTAHPSLSRIDLVVMGLSYTARKISLYVKTGAPSSAPVTPALESSSSLHELALCKITVPGGAGSITQSMITDTRMDSGLCGIVTGTIDQIDATDLFAQFTEEFNTWFDSIRDHLSEDPATALQQQIDVLSASKVNINQGTSSSNFGLYVNKLGKIEPTNLFKVVEDDSETTFEISGNLHVTGKFTLDKLKTFVENVFGRDYKSYQSISEYPSTPGIYRTVGTNIFKNLSFTHGNYGVLVILKAEYAMHIYIDEYLRVFMGRSSSTFGEPSWEQIDGITEKGTSGIWSYTKYASGFVECFGSKTYSGNPSEEWGGLYALVCNAENYPVTFVGNPNVQRDVLLDNNAGCFLVPWSSAAQTHCGKFALVRTSNLALNATVKFHVTGYWK